ncbi:MAG: glycosyltransferase [Gammaproteobacteria bacterium]|nr:glycosyltransferase [Gammaproteobacteria bacterium]
MSGKALKKISCIITSYNNLPFLHDAIESVLRQTVPVAEIIVADDCSTDASRQVIRDYAERYDNIIPIYQDVNIGVSANRQAAFERASGVYVTWLDGDDTFSPDKIERELRLIEEENTDVVISEVMMTRNSGKKEFINFNGFPGFDGKKRFIWLLFHKGRIPTHMLVRRDAFIRSGGFDKEIPIYEDWDLKLRLSACTRTWSYNKNVGYIYRKTGVGLSSASIVSRIFSEIRVIKKNGQMIVGVLDSKSYYMAIIAVPIRYFRRAILEMSRKLFGSR